MNKSPIPGDHDLFVIARQSPSDHLGDVTGRSLKSHQVRLALDRQLCSGIGGPRELNVDLFFEGRVRHRNQLTFFAAGEMAPVFIVWFAPIPNMRRIANAQFRVLGNVLRRLTSCFLDRKSGKLMANHFLCDERIFYKSIIFRLLPTGLEPATL